MHVVEYILRIPALSSGLIGIPLPLREGRGGSSGASHGPCNWMIAPSLLFLFSSLFRRSVTQIAQNTQIVPVSAEFEWKYVYMLFRLSSASIGLKTSSLIGRVARYTPSSTYVLRLDRWQDLFDKPNEQSQACLDSAMARNVSTGHNTPPLRIQFIWLKCINTKRKGTRRTARFGIY